jgi:hypothetical protein
VKRDNTFITIGRYPIISLAKARDQAKRLLAAFTLGRVRPQSVTFGQALEFFLADKRQGRRSRIVDDYERLLDRFGFKGQLAHITADEASRKPPTARLF